MTTIVRAMVLSFFLAAGFGAGFAGAGAGFAAPGGAVGGFAGGGAGLPGAAAVSAGARATGGLPGRVQWQPDAVLQGVLDAWPRRFDSARARALGIYGDTDLPTLLADALHDLTP